MLKRNQVKLALTILGAWLILAAAMAVLPQLSSLPGSEPVHDYSRPIEGLRVRSIQPGELEITWDAPAGAPLDYRLSWARVGQNFPAQHDQTGNAFPTTSSHVITGLDQGERYQVRVRARYDGSESDWSSPVELMVASSSTEPTGPAAALSGPPLDLKAESSPNSVTLSWSAPQSTGRVSGYQILRRDQDADPEGQFQVLEDSTGTSATSYVDNTVLPDRRYTYRVSARNENARGSEYADVEATTQAATTASVSATTPVSSLAAASTPSPAPTATTARQDSQSLSQSGLMPALVSERDALIALYHATGGANWAQDGNWLTDEPLGSWRGVTTDRNGSVIELDLNRNLLSGYIPAGLGSLPHLKILRMSGNNLEGPIPAALSNLSALTNLELDNNNLFGSIPAELGKLLNLTWLDLSGNDLSGPVPTELSQLTRLSVVALSGNGLTGAFPWWLSELDDLLILHLAGNEFTGCMPADLLTILIEDLSDTRLPTCREALTTFYFATGGPQWQRSTNWRDPDSPLAQWFGVTTDDVGRVTAIDLSANRLTGTLPPRLGALIHLQALDLSDNKLVGPIPPDLTDLTNLSTLYLGGNRLTGCVPAKLREIENNDLATLGLDFCR
ncbi:MAG: fibronectin type III domain-containing protein [Caldilineaceae bacterium]|nr:fibronectin type III domain-containing protein [Caldilineaceae bacterium]